MEMYNVHQDAKLIPIVLNTDDYAYGNEKLPAVSASASVDATGAVHISLANINASKEETVSIKVEGNKYKKISGTILTSPKLQDHNTFENPDKIKPETFSGASLKDDLIKLIIPPFSVIVLELK